MGNPISSDAEGSAGRAALEQRIAALDQSLEQALVAAEDAQEEARLLAEERAGLTEAVLEQWREITDLRARLDQSETARRSLEAALGRSDGRLRAVRREESQLMDELQTSYEELQVLTESLEEANADLERRVAERTAELSAANADLRRAKEIAETADRAKSRFLAAASHDLRQPIQAAALYIHVLTATLGTSPEAQEALHFLRASIESLNDMLSGLLDLSRLEAGAVDFAIEDFAPDALMRRLAVEFGGVAEASGVRLVCLPCSTPVTTDVRLLERVLRNLLSNAITHGAPQGRGRVLLGCRRRSGAVEFQVWDNGRGIPPEARDSIFEEFRQLENPERNAAKGFGLGLSIVSRIVGLLDLTLDLRSEVGRGTVFTLTVPRARKPARAVALPARGFDPSALERIRGRCILLVEDDERVRAALTMLLERWGANVVAMGSAEELADRLPRLRSRPHVVLADHRLPGGHTARNVVDLVRGRWDVPAVIITGDTAPERLREAKAIGCQLLHKPVQPADLAHTLGAVIPS